MKLLSLKNLAMTGALSIGGLGLVGIGTHAVFTQTTASAQTITAGTMNVTLSSATASSGNGTANLGLATANAYEGSTFVETGNVLVTNSGNIPVSEVALAMSDQNNNVPMLDALWACFYSDGEVLVNEPLTTIEGYGPGVVAGGIAVGGTDSYTVVIYAGATDGGCGPAFSGFSGGSYSTNELYTAGSPPALGNNLAAAAGLPNGAQGGTVIPALTLTYNG
jgi:predicted ribosomally synthesized peptide with SipW-like signal peptide